MVRRSLHLGTRVVKRGSTRGLSAAVRLLVRRRNSARESGSRAQISQKMFADAKAGLELPHSKILVGGGDAEGFHFAVEVGAFEADGVGGLRHVPAIFLKLTEDEFAFVGAAGFVQRAIRLLCAFDHATKKFRRKMVWLDADLGANNDQTLD